MAGHRAGGRGCPVGATIPVLQGAFFLTAIVVVRMNLVVDILYGYLDPRVRVAGRGPGVTGLVREGPRWPAIP